MIKEAYSEFARSYARWRSCLGLSMAPSHRW